MRTSRFRRGLVVTEAALILPLVLLLTFAVIEYAWMFLRTQQITNAARSGARVGATADATSADVLLAVQSWMDRASLGSSGYQVSIATPEDADVGALESGQVLTVQVTVPYANITLTGMPMVPTPAQLRSSVSMAKEGP